MRPLYRNALVGLLAAVLVASAALAWGTGRQEPDPRPPREVVVGESVDPNASPSERPSPDVRPSPSPEPTDSPCRCDDDDDDDDVVDPPPAVTDDDDDGDDQRDDDDD
ncbi:hypothetical protein [Nocardiopsis gilva]|uniref:hypothetical protein n=1 Tax=Nocardiopsis gilva TaxID=280236 RepID=UPI000349E72F|nr:hypothetical protein [Nocardiopsis gilva]